MSDLLARLAARAVGETVAAQPRLPARFEANAGTEGSESGFELVEREVIAETPSDIPVAPQRGPTAVRRSDDHTDTARPTAPRAGDRPSSAGIAGQAQEVASLTRRREAPGPPADKRGSPAIGAVGPDRVMTVARAAIDASGDPLLRSAGPVPASPVPASTAGPPRAFIERGGTASASAPEPPAVRVHIGRLEIRASLPEPTPPPSRAQRVHEPAARSVSLADYLRGAR